MKNTKVTLIDGKTIKFTEFVSMLARATKGGVLQDVIISNCNIIDIPKDFTCINIGKKIKGRKFDLFFGFICSGVNVLNNVFRAKK